MRRTVQLGCTVFFLAVAPLATVAGPLEIILNPSPQEFSNTCQSYSMALAVSMTPASPIKADNVLELRDLERKIRQELISAAKSNDRVEPVRDDWRTAIQSVTNGVLTVEWQEFAHLDPAMRRVAELTGISDPEGLGPVLSVALVQTPAMLSFKSVESSSYGTSHIVTALGVQLPNATMDDTAKPKLLLVNSAVKYKNGVKNVCAAEDLSDNDRYRAITSLTAKYKFNLFSNPKPYLITWVRKK